MHSLSKSVWVNSVILAIVISSANSSTITVDAHAEKCFFENVEADTKMGLTFDIIEGGFLDIDVKITGPDGTVIYRGERETSGMYTFSAPTSGRYTYCFSNQKFTMTPKVVMYNFEVGEAPHKGEEKDKEVDHNKLEDMIKELGSTLKTVKKEQEHKALGASINYVR